MITKAFIAALALAVLGLLALAGAIGFGGPGEPAPMASINDPFNGIDDAALPAVQRFTARDGHCAAWRAYVPESSPARR